MNLIKRITFMKYITDAPGGGGLSRLSSPPKRNAIKTKIDSKMRGGGSYEYGNVIVSNKTGSVIWSGRMGVDEESRTSSANF